MTKQSALSRFASLSAFGFALVVLAFAVLTVVGAQFGPIDDHLFLSSIRQGKPLPLMIAPDIGRFYPLAAAEYNVLTWVPHPPATLFYLFNFAEYLLLFALLWGILGEISARWRLAFLSFLILSPGIVTAYYRLVVPEKDAILLFAAFLACYLKFEKTRRPGFAVLAFLLGTVALYYKEPAFLMLGGFAFLHQLLAWVGGTKERSNRALDLGLMVSAATFAVTYYLVIFRHMGPHRYGESDANPFIVLLKTVINFGLSDPLIAVFLPLLVAYRVYVVVTKRDTLVPLFDALAGAGLIYALAYVALKMHANHYMLPAYAFALPAFAFFFERHLPSLDRRWRTAGLALVLVACLNAMAIGVGILSLNKSVPRNHAQMLVRLMDELPPGQKTAVYLDGVDPNMGKELFMSLTAYLEASGIPSSRFELRSTLSDASHPAAGDLLLIPPQTQRDVSETYLTGLQQDYRLLHATRSRFSIPELSIKTGIKMALGPLKGLFPALFLEERSRILPDYYLLRKL